MVWALKKARVADALHHIVLISLADHANPDGTSAWPSRATLADDARCSVRTVQRALNALESEGFIRRGDQQLVEHFPANRRPIVWDVIMTTSDQGVSRGDNVSPQDVGVTPGAVRGDTPGHSGVTLLAHKPSSSPSGKKPSYEPSVSARARATTTQGTRIPDDWMPSEAARSWTSERMDPGRVCDTLDAFRDYWRAQPGQRGRKADWDATWRNWVRRELRSPAGPSRQRESTAERRRREYEQVMQELDGMGG